MVLVWADEFVVIVCGGRGGSGGGVGRKRGGSGVLLPCLRRRLFDLPKTMGLHAISDGYVVESRVIVGGVWRGGCVGN